MHIKHHVLTYVTVGKTALFSQHEPKDEVCGHSFPRTESSSQRQEFPAFLRIVVCICLVVMAVRLFLDSPSFWQCHQKHEERLSSVILEAVFSFF